jgi:flagellar L-ring protein FlgH
VKKTASALSLAVILTSCAQSQIDRLEKVGMPPDLNKIEPVAKATKVDWPVPNYKENIPSIRTANSIWDSGSRQFFKDQRARMIGDILTVKVKIDDQAQFDNKTEQKRNGAENVKAPDVFGLEKRIAGVLPGKADPASLLDLTSTTNNTGEGKLNRKEKLETEVAAVITQILPNGNLVIHGSQEARVNHEVRELTIDGVIRPGDISPSNTVDYNRIAEARISYGGKGTLSDVQYPRAGREIIDILSPF